MNNGIQTTQKKRRRRSIVVILSVAGILLSCICAAVFIAGLVWDGRAGREAQQEVGLIFGSTPTPIPPPILDIQSVNTDKGTLVVSGTGTPGASIEYLGQRVGVVSGEGKFFIALPVNSGLTMIVLDVVDRYGRTSRMIQVPGQAAVVGQPATIGKVKLTLVGAGTDAIVGKPPLQTKAEGIYLKLIINVVSDLSEPLNLRTWNLVLRDGQGREYRPADQAEFAYGWDTAEGRLSGRVVPPNVKATGWTLFDVAPNATNLTLRASSDGIGPQWAAELAVPDGVLKGAK